MLDQFDQAALLERREAAACRDRRDGVHVAARQGGDQRHACCLREQLPAWHAAQRFGRKVECQPAQAFVEQFVPRGQIQGLEFAVRQGLDVLVEKFDRDGPAGLPDPAAMVEGQSLFVHLDHARRSVQVLDLLAPSVPTLTVPVVGDQDARRSMKIVRQLSVSRNREHIDWQAGERARAMGEYR
jgi:hypothetical protein